MEESLSTQPLRHKDTDYNEARGNKYYQTSLEQTLSFQLLSQKPSTKMHGTYAVGILQREFLKMRSLVE
jgi:hypothetical protein